MNRVLKIGTRGSRLALQQTREVIELLRKFAPDNHYEICVVQSSGDRGCREEVGAFTAELECAVLDGRVDAAVHSYKDLPISTDNRLAIAAVPVRACPEDVLLSHRSDALKTPELKVGTSSHRRKAMLAFHRPGWAFYDIYGNIDLRIKKLREDTTLDAIVVARAALQRGGFELQGLHSEEIPGTILLPAPAQGAIALQCLKDNSEILALGEKINHFNTATCAKLEREFLRHLGGGCGSPFGCLAEFHEGKIHVSAQWLSGSHVLHSGHWIYASAEEAIASFAEISNQWLSR